MSMLFIIILVVMLLLFYDKGAVLLVLVVGGIGIYWQFFYRSSFNAEEKQNLIGLQEVILSDVTANKTFGVWEVTGKAQNNNRQYAVEYLALSARLFDCESEVYNVEKCKEVENESTTFYIDILPGQTVNFKTNMDFSQTLRAEHNRIWDFRVVGVGGNYAD